MRNKKTKILYEGTLIAQNIDIKIRTGIFIVAYNTLKEMLKNENLEIDLYCEYNFLESLKTVVKELFPNENLKIITDIYNNDVSFICDKLYQKKNKYRQQNKPIKKFFTSLLLSLAKRSYVVSKFIAMFNMFKFLKYDAFYSAMYKVPDFLYRYKNIKKYVFLHDIIPIIYPQYFPDYENHWHKDLMDSINKNTWYFSNSEYTRQDFIKYCKKMDPNKNITTLLACDEKFKQKSNNEINKIKEKYNIPLDKKYVFSLCTLEPRKNLIRTVKTFIDFIKKNNIENMVFILGGGHWERFIKQLEKEIENLGEYKDKVLKIGYVDDEDLAALYSGAEWFVYTSQYEGFGLPPLEAMSCGCPVITSNNSSLPEVVGNAGIMIDYDSDEQHVQAYEKYYYDENYKKEMTQKGLERSKQFSWEKCANQIIEVMLN